MSKLISTETKHNPAMPGIDATLLAVLVQDGQGKYRAYVGLVPESGEALAERDPRVAWVRQYGRKMTFKEAVPEYFVGITERDYAA